MGLIARAIEQAGIPTACISLVREISEKVKPPRTVFLRWPFGHPLGEPHNAAQHRAVLKELFRLLETARTPGVIEAPPFGWRRHNYADAT